jgi:hypothetical protein
LAGRGRGEGLGALGARFDGLDGGEAAPASGTPTTGGGDRRGCPERRASGWEGQWAVGVASKGASGGGEGLLGSGFGSPPELAAAGPQGAGAAQVRRGSAGRGVLAQGGGTTALSKEVTSCSGAHVTSQARLSTVAASVGAHQDGSRLRTGR